MFGVAISSVQAVEWVGGGAPGNNPHKNHHQNHHHHDYLNHITVATGRWLVVLQGRTTEEPRLPKISPENDHFDDDADDYIGVLGNDDNPDKG